jgi:peroxiredoxin family protein
LASLGLLLAAKGELSRAIRYAAAARAAGVSVRVFVTFEAVGLLGDPAVDALAAEAEVVACAQTARAMGVRPRPGIALGSQFDHAEIAAAVDRYLALT